MKIIQPVTRSQFEAKVRRRFVRIAGRKQGGAPKRCTLDEKFTNLVWSQIHTPKQFEAKVRRRFFHIDGQRQGGTLDEKFTNSV